MRQATEETSRNTADPIQLMDLCESKKRMRSNTEDMGNARS